ncbi:shikimate kinase [Litorivivens lipolytica]|uniref:Shikimate kinase n=1 Tax=Litorivivens lipolytica TaxID=1524264 RepID=A0A7W4Z7C3_9GAMM|nr:shikimate kinase AroK [Litorivivens lipolytica]MBB3047776.1 shikimate kinase [Litorivivens lipolytica]
MKYPRVFLVGPMGAGKSTIGRLLADDLHLEFRDADREIEERSGVDIPWIFDKEGEAGFRDRETAMIEELSQLEGVLVSTGGGVVGRPENRELMKRGAVVYLHASVDEQVRRTAKDKKRPLLQNANPRKVLEELMAVRDPLYREVATIIVHTDGRGPRAVANEIRRLLA